MHSQTLSSEGTQTPRSIMSGLERQPSSSTVKSVKFAGQPLSPDNICLLCSLLLRTLSSEGPQTPQSPETLTSLNPGTRSIMSGLER